MKKKNLSNGLTVIFQRKKADSVAIEITIKVGSNHEPLHLSGIAHFVEHMLFEGTTKRPNSTIISNEIEKLGGIFNAYTSTERTCYYIKAHKKHFEIALDILSDIVQNPLFEKKAVEKERQVILKEINMVKDEPRLHQWVLFQKALFRKHPARNPTYGNVKTVKAMTREDLLNFYKKYYAPNNMIITIVGDIAPLKKVHGSFTKAKGKLPPYKKIKEPKHKIMVKRIEKRKILASYLVLGYQTPSRHHKDSYILDVIKSLLGRGQSGKIVEEIRNKRGLAYEVNVIHDSNRDYGFFAVYLNTDRKNIGLCIAIIMDIFRNLAKVTREELADAKGFIEGQHALENEDTYELADELSFWETIMDASLAKNYVKKIMRISQKDVARAAKKYLHQHYTLALIEQSGK